MPRMRLADIAAQAGVSPATVSKYLNGHYREMSEATRARIAEVVERTGYRPNSTARNLRLDRSHTLGVVLADIRNPYSSAMLEELSAQAADAGYALTCAISGNDPAKEASALERLMEAGVDGFIVNTCGDNDERLAEINRRAPVVLLDRDIDPAGAKAGHTMPGSSAPNATGAAQSLDLVTSNNAELVSSLVCEVAGSGTATCARIHLLTEQDPNSSIRRERALTFMRELASCGLAGSTLALSDDPTAAARQLSELAVTSEPLGLIAINGLVFQQLVEAIAISGLSVPEQLRIATFDEYPWNRVLFGGVTTAAQDTSGIAAAILELLIGRIVGSEKSGNALVPQRLEIPGRVIARASTAAQRT